MENWKKTKETQGVRFHVNDGYDWHWSSYIQRGDIHYWDSNRLEGYGYIQWKYKFLMCQYYTKQYFVNQ